MFKKMLSLLLAVMMVVSLAAVGVVNTGAAEVPVASTGDLDPATLYFDSSTTGWEFGEKSKISFHIFGGDFGTEENSTTGLAWGTKKALGTAVADSNGVFSFKPSAKGLTLNEGVQYKIIFGFSKGGTGAIDGGQTYDLLFTTDCLGHIAYCDGTEYENPVDSSKKTLAAFWQDMDASEVGPVLQISSIGNVVGTCPEAGKTPQSIFNDFLTVVNSETGVTAYENALHFVVEPGTKTEQKLIDDIGADLGLAKQDIQAAFEAAEIETTWDYAASTVHEHTPGEPVRENEVAATFTSEGSYDEVTYCSGCGEEISREHKTIEQRTPDPDTLYFDSSTTGWDMGTKGKISFHIFGGDLENGLAWGTKKALGTAVSGMDGMFSFKPSAKGLTLNEGVQYKIIFGFSKAGTGAIDGGQTYDLLFTTDCLGHIAYCDGTEYENPVDSSKKTLAAFWHDMDASVVGPVKQISSIGNVVGTCLAEGTTDESLFTDFLTVVDSTTNKTKYENAYQFVVEPGTKTEQKMIDDIGTDLGLTKQQIFDAFYNNNIETAWDYTVSTLPGDVTPPHTHTPGDPVIENDHASTCTTAGSYEEVIYCTECHEELSRETKCHELAAHTPGEAVQENIVHATCNSTGSFDDVVYCTVCHAELSRTPRVIQKLNHTPGDPVIENDHASTCTVRGSYDEVVYCTACQTELSRETKYHDLAPHTPGNAVIENDHVSTCTVKGAYDEVTYCTACQTELSRETKYHDLAPHTPGTAVHENEVVTHDKTTYDEVIYCTVCQAEISRTPVELPIITHTLTYVPEVPATEQAAGTKAHYTCSGCTKLFADAAGTQEVTAASLIIPKLDHVHTPGQTVIENEVAATCKAAGSYDEVVYCTSCHAELSRTHKTIAKLAHTPGTAVRENEVPATCTAAGSYDEVVYCTVCHDELSRTHKTIAKLAHTLTFKPYQAATEEADGWNAHYQCTECGKYFSDAEGKNELTWDQIVIPRIVIGKRGDIDGDGKITILDVTCLQRVLAGIKARDSVVEKLGDVDGDGSLTAVDTTLLQRWLLGLNQDLDIGENV